MSSLPPERIRRVLRQHVLTDRLLGIQCVPLGDVALSAPAAVPASVSAVANRPGAQPAYPSADRPATRPAPPPVAPSRTRSADEVYYQSALPNDVDLPDGRAMSRDQRLTILQAMDQNEVQSCTLCVLHQSRTRTVFGEGSPTAELMFIGEGPGETEDRLGRPFVGPAGELLDKMIVAMGLSRQEVYIANAVKCRPPANRVPTPMECDTCGRYLSRQIAIIRPKVIVTLGGPATKYILDTQTGITALRGRWRSYDVLPDQDPIPVMPTFHPAYVLRNYTTEVRKLVWTDLQAARDRLQSQ